MSRASFVTIWFRSCSKCFSSASLPSASPKGCRIGRGVAASPSSVTSSSAVSAAAAATAAVACHLGQTRVYALLRLGQDGNEITRLFCVCVR